MESPDLADLTQHSFLSIIAQYCHNGAPNALCICQMASLWGEKEVNGYCGWVKCPRGLMFRTSKGVALRSGHLPSLPLGLSTSPALLSWAQTPRSLGLPWWSLSFYFPVFLMATKLFFIPPAKRHLLAASAHSFSSAPGSDIILKSNSFSIWQWLKYGSNCYLLLPVCCRQELPNDQTLARIPEILTLLTLLWTWLTITAQKCCQLCSCLT